MLERIKVALWLLTKGRNITKAYQALQPIREQMISQNSEETIRFITEHNCSVSRFGDGEFQLIQNYLNKLENKKIEEVDTFQNYHEALAKRLYEIIQQPSTTQHINCIPYALKNSRSFRGYSRIFFEREALIRLPHLLSPLPGPFYDTCFSRFYMERADIKDYPAYIKMMQQIWEQKDILFIEGEQSRLGVGNDLFSNAKSIQRILGPATNAFDKYEQILTAAKTHGEGKLVLIALGQTATVLAYDLAQSGFQAIDIGHVDVEYEWYRMKATKKVPIPGKYVNEVKEGRIYTECSNQEDYLSQIIERIV